MGRVGDNDVVVGGQVGDIFEHRVLVMAVEGEPRKTIDRMEKARQQHLATRGDSRKSFQSASAFSIAVATSAAVWASARPADVKTMPRPTRSVSGIPASRSKIFSC